MIDAIRRICELQPKYSAGNTPDMEERGKLLRHDLVGAVRALGPILSPALGKFGDDFLVEASDGIGRKTELPWVRFCARSMSPTPRDGYYCVLHFSTDGSAVHLTVGCSSSQFINGSFVTLKAEELDRRTNWARQMVFEAEGTFEPFVDVPDFGATRPLPKSFEQATALSKRIEVDALDEQELHQLMIKAADYLRIIYQGEADGRDQSPADKDELEIIQTIRPSAQRRGQSFGLSALDKRRVELRAMKLVEEWLKTNGYSCKDTSASKPYDFEARKGDILLKVEVKGTTSENVDAISMTRNEVTLHRSEKGATALFIVSCIRLVGDGEKRSAKRGRIEALIGWDIDDWKMTPTAFRVERN